MQKQTLTSKKHTLKWQRPHGMSFPKLIEMGISRLQSVQDRPRSMLALALADAVPVYRADQQSRRRRLRSDGRQNLITLLTCLLTNADLKSGLVAKPVADSTKWERHGWSAIDFRAYGELVANERSIRRTERHAREAIDAGWLQTQPWKTTNANGDWRSLPGLKTVTDKLWKLLGLYAQLKTARRQRDRERNKDRLKRLALLDGAHKKPSRQCKPKRVAQPSAVPIPLNKHPPPSDPASPIALAELAKIKKLFSIK